MGINAQVSSIKHAQGVTVRYTNNVYRHLVEIAARARRIFRARKYDKTFTDSSFSDDIGGMRKIVRNLVQNVSVTRPKVKLFLRTSGDTIPADEAQFMRMRSKKLDSLVAALHESSRSLAMCCVDAGDKNVAVYIATDLRKLADSVGGAGGGKPVE